MTATSNKDLIANDCWHCSECGVGICYDIRFGELTTLYNRAGCQLLVYPAAFNMTTGPAHWELLGRSTALSSQTYVVLCAPARDTSATYVSYGNSMLINPWGTILCQADDEEMMKKKIYADIDLEFLKEVRDSIPIGKQRRTDMRRLLNPHWCHTAKLRLTHILSICQWQYKINYCSLLIKLIDTFTVTPSHILSS